MTTSWLIGPTVGYFLNGVLPRDPVEPEKLTLGAAAVAGMIVFGFLGLSAIAGLCTVISQWRTTRWTFKALLATPIVLLFVFWLGLVAEGM